MSFEHIKVENRGKALVVTLDRDEKRNAINEKMGREIMDAYDQADADPDVRAIILTHVGSCLCAGMDLSDPEAQVQREDGDAVCRICRKRPQKPVICVVDGKAFGGGLEIAAACDMVIASESTVFGLTEVRRGLVPGSGGIVRLQKRIPLNAAMEIAITGEPFSAQRMYELGLVNHVLPADEIMDKALEVAESIAKGAPMAVAICKETILGSELVDWEANFAAQSRNQTFEDSKEGPRAFLEKREPVWTGR